MNIIIYGPNEPVYSKIIDMDHLYETYLKELKLHNKTIKTTFVHSDGGSSFHNSIKVDGEVQTFEVEYAPSIIIDVNDEDEGDLIDYLIDLDTSRKFLFGLVKIGNREIKGSEYNYWDW